MRTTQMSSALGAALIGFALTSCGGGGGESTPTVSARPGRSAGDIRAVTGLLPPMEGNSSQKRKADDVVGRADSLISSSLTTNSITYSSDCSSTYCTYRGSGGEYGELLRLSDLPLGNTSGLLLPSNQPLGSKYGVTVVSEQVDSVWSMRGWMDHSAFSSGEFSTTDFSDIRGATVIGDQSPLFWGANEEWRNEMTLTYRGLMVGTPITGMDAGDRLTDDAMLIYRNAGSGGNDTLDARFSNITNIDDLKVHSVRAVSFSGIDVQVDGDFGGNIPGNRIRGSFYGSNRDEAAGVFEKSGIVGAFGAKRQ